MQKYLLFILFLFFSFSVYSQVQMEKDAKYFLDDGVIFLKDKSCKKLKRYLEDIYATTLKIKHHSKKLYDVSKNVECIKYKRWLCD